MNANKQDAGGEVTNPDNVGGLPPLPNAADLSPTCEFLYTAAQMRAYGELCRAAPAGMVLVPREIVANYRESTHIPRHRRICDSALAAPAGGDASANRAMNCGAAFQQQECAEASSTPAGSGEVDEDIDGLCRSLEFMAEHSDSVGFNSDAECLRTAAALLRKLQQGADYVMVPREPTSKMAALGAIAHKERGMAAAYRAMIAASQEGGTNG